MIPTFSRRAARSARRGKSEMKQREINKEKLCYILYFVASVSFYIAAIFYYVTGEVLFGTANLSLGSAMLCLGAVWLNKSNKVKENADTNADKAPDDSEE